ncbi:MAG: hypothetical protein ACT4UQ_09320 [Gammaproteobacteria bacterium]
MKGREIRVGLQSGCGRIDFEYDPHTGVGRSVERFQIEAHGTLPEVRRYFQDLARQLDRADRIRTR